MQKHTKSLFYLSIFFGVVFVLKYILYKDIYLVLNHQENKFVFTNFLFASLGYLFKMILIFGVFKLSLYIFDVEEQSSIFDIVILGELVKILLIGGLKIIVFYYLSHDMTLEMFSKFESNYTISGIFNLHLSNNLSTVINSINVFYIVYIIVVVMLFSANFKLTKIKSFKVVGLPYFLLLFIIGFIKIFMTI